MRTFTALGLLLVALAAACSDRSESPALSSSTIAVASTIIEGEGCPVADEAFCAAATEVGNALAARDVDRLTALSRVDRIGCAEVNAASFPGCDEADVVEGHGVSDAGFLVTMVDDAEYRSRLEAAVGAIVPEFSDGHGDGAVRLLGVGSCGPDEPGRRSYHLAWTAAMGDEPRRMVGSFELIDGDDWRIALWYLDTLEAWQSGGDDPFTDAFCEAGRHPWQG